MIRVELGIEAKPGLWAYKVEGMPVEGRSRQPLLDACRQIKSLGGDTAALAGLFRQGRTVPDISCSVEVGASLTVREKDNGPVFAKWMPFDEAVREK